MDLGRIYYLQEEVEAERVSSSEAMEIHEAFLSYVERVGDTRDEPANATLSDMLEELEGASTTVERAIYDWVKNNLGESEANDPSWSTSQLADSINQIPVILGAEDSKLGFLLGETK